MILKNLEAVKKCQLSPNYNLFVESNKLILWYLVYRTYFYPCPSSLPWNLIKCFWALGNETFYLVYALEKKIRSLETTFQTTFMFLLCCRFRSCSFFKLAYSFMIFSTVTIWGAAYGARINTPVQCNKINPYWCGVSIISAKARTWQSKASIGLVIFSFGDDFSSVNATEGWLTRELLPTFEARSVILEFSG